MESRKHYHTRGRGRVQPLQDRSTTFIHSQLNYWKADPVKNAESIKTAKEILKRRNNARHSK